jgi:hypothetical protein
MQLITIQRFRTTTDLFEAGSMPTEQTLKRWIDDGTIEGRRIGRKYYVDLDAFQSAEDALVDSILNAHS